MAEFDEFNDAESSGENMVIVDPSDPTKKVKVVNSELGTTDVVNTVSTPIHTSVGMTAVRIDNPIIGNRKEVTIQVNKDVYIGYANTVTSSNYAFFLRKGQLIDLVLGPSIQLWAISGSAGGTSDVVVNQGAA